MSELIHLCLAFMPSLPFVSMVFLLNFNLRRLSLETYFFSNGWKAKLLCSYWKSRHWCCNTFAHKTFHWTVFTSTSGSLWYIRMAFALDVAFSLFSFFSWEVFGGLVLDMETDWWIFICYSNCFAIFNAVTPCAILGTAEIGYLPNWLMLLNFLLTDLRGNEKIRFPRVVGFLGRNTALVHKKRKQKATLDGIFHICKWHRDYAWKGYWQIRGRFWRKCQ